MKKRHLFLAILAVILVLSVSIGPTIAYFTSYAGGNGGYVIHLGHETRIWELVGDLKQVQIQNILPADAKQEEIGKYPVFIRAMCYSGTTCITTPVSSENWTQEGEYFYYEIPIYADFEHDPNGKADMSTTSQLKIKVEADPDADLRPGEPIDVLVTYQSVPAVFDPDGNPLRTQAWANQAAITDING